MLPRAICSPCVRPIVSHSEAIGAISPLLVHLKEYLICPSTPFLRHLAPLLNRNGNPDRNKAKFRRMRLFDVTRRTCVLTGFLVLSLNPSVAIAQSSLDGTWKIDVGRLPKPTGPPLV
jgi:hypothetical protein